MVTMLSDRALDAVFAADDIGNADLTGAPTLNAWGVTKTRSGIALAGEVSGHPDLPGDRRTVETSDLVRFSADLSHARTVSRWYRLGESLYPDTELQLIFRASEVRFRLARARVQRN